MRPLALALVVSVSAAAAEPERTVKTNEKVLEFVAGRIEDFYVDPEGPPGWPDEWHARFREMVEITETCAFYVKLDDLLKETGVSHFGAVPPRDARDEKARRAFRGLRLARIGGRYFVRASAGALAAAGVHAGDELIDVAGRAPAEFFADFGCGAPPASMRLRVASGDGESVEVDLSSAAEPLPDEDWLVAKGLDGGAAYLRVRSFGAAYEPGAVDAAIEGAGAAKRLILDLRGNPGGTDRSMSDLLGHFYARSFTLGSFVNRRFGKYATAKAKYLANYLRARNLTPVTMFGRRDIVVDAAAPRYLGPLFVLVDPYTGSAAEMAAATLQRTRRAAIVGERTAGAVLAVLTFTLPDGGRLAMPAATFLDPDGRPVEGSGVVPDVEAGPTREDLVEGRDGALAVALALAATPPPSAAPPSREPPRRP